MGSILKPETIDAISKLSAGAAFFILCIGITITLYKFIQNTAKAQQRSDEQEAKMLGIISDFTTALNGVREALRKISDSDDRQVAQMALMGKEVNDHTRLVTETLSLLSGDINSIHTMATASFTRVIGELEGIKAVVDRLPDADVLKAEIGRVMAVVDEMKKEPPPKITGEVKAAILAEAAKEKPRVDGAAEITSEADKGTA